MIAERIRIELCMGSSCFARGNSNVLMAVENFIEENDLADRIELEGHLCLGNCKSGPHVKIDGNEYSGLTGEEVITLLKKLLEV